MIDIQKLKLDAARYQHVRQLNPSEFEKIWQDNLIGHGSFDDLVDAHMAQK